MKVLHITKYLVVVKGGGGHRLSVDIGPVERYIARGVVSKWGEGGAIG